MKKYFLVVVVLLSGFLAACQSTPTQPDNKAAIVAPETVPNCELMPAIVEKTCVAADPTEQYLHLLMIDEQSFALELKSTEPQFQQLLVLIRKQIGGLPLSAEEKLQLMAVDTNSLAPSWQAVLRVAQQMQQQADQQRNEIKALQQEVEKQAELIKRLKDLTLGQ